MYKYPFVLLSMLSVLATYAQNLDGLDSDTPNLKVNLDCSFCDDDYMRQEIDYVDYVRDQGNADVHIFYVRNSSGGGGRVYEISFFGKNDFEDSFFKLQLATSKLDSPNEVRAKIKETTAAGLVPFLYNSRPGYSINVTQEEISENELNVDHPNKDPWRSWVFEIYGSGDFEWESQQREIEFEYGLEVDKITPEYRFSHDLYNSTEKRIIQDTREIKITRSFYSGRYIKSIDGHWSTGIFTRLESNSYRNIDLLSKSSIALEYNIFPWAMLSKKQFTFNYQIGYLYQEYGVETIFDQMNDLVPVHTLGAEIIFNRPWGRIDNEIEYSQFVNNPERRRLEWDFNIRVRLFKGLSARFSGGYEIVRDQINLSKGEASIEDIISKQREIATEFGGDFTIGLSYTFGSIYNNTVNNRL